MRMLLDEPYSQFNLASFKYKLAILLEISTKRIIVVHTREGSVELFFYLLESYGSSRNASFLANRLLTMWKSKDPALIGVG